MPLAKTGSGSLTQWIMVCNCGGLEENTAGLPPVFMCTICGKRMEEGRSGTLTQWIFRADRCACDRPGLPETAVLRADSAAPQGRTDAIPELEDWPELPADPASFPVDRYGPVQCLGAGSDGSVYLCKDRLLKKSVAVKVLNNLNNEQLIAFQREAKATSQLEHPNIVKVMDFGVTDGRYPYMVLEFIDGISLDKLLEQCGVLELEDALFIIDQVCDALIFAHGRSSFHRDLKPSNIIVVGFGSPQPGARLIDFGVCLFKQGETYQGATLAGTPAYMSPDQALGREFDARSEVYSLGCLLFQMLTGRTPFQTTSSLDAISMHARETPPSLSVAHGSQPFPRKIEEIVATCLKKSPEQRYQSIAEVKESLQEAYLEAISTVSAAGENQTEPAKDTNKSMPHVFIAVAALCTICGGIFLFRLFSDVSASYTGPPKASEKPPELKDALNALDTGVWQRGMDDIGSDGWTSGPNMGDESIKQLAKKANVETIHIALTDSFTGVGFKYLQGRNIKRITLRSTGLTDEGLAEIAKFKTLESLRISLAAGITADGLAKLQDLPGLRSLELVVLNVPEGGLEAVSRIKSVEAISLYNARNITAEGVESLRDLPNFSFLDLSRTRLSKEVVPAVAKIKTLTELRLNAADITDEDLEAISHMSELEQIRVSVNPRITEEGLFKLGKCKKLELLTADRCPNISNAARLKFKNKYPRVSMAEGRDTGTRLMDSIEPLSTDGEE